MSSPTRYLIGVTGMGIGLILMYAAVKNLAVLGPDGIFRQMLTTGKVDVKKAGESGSLSLDDPLGINPKVPPSAPSPKNIPPGTIQQPDIGIPV